MAENFEPSRRGPASNLDEPQHWLGNTPLLDLEDTKLRLRAHALTQLCKNEREKALAVYGFTKRIPFARPIKLRLHTARQVIDGGRGDATDKATVFVALLRAVEIPARLHYFEMRGEILRGLTSSVASGARPVVEAWLNGTWVPTDTYIFDAVYMAAARQRLKDHDWEWGYGIHRNGHTVWNGHDGAWLGGGPTRDDPMVIDDLGLFNDPQEYLASEAFTSQHPRLARAVQWNMLSPLMERVIRDLREEGRTGAPAPGVKKSS